MALQFITPYSIRIGVVGAGTMGRGIALTALLRGIPVTLYDLAPAMLESAHAYIRTHLERKNQPHHQARLTLTEQLQDLADAQVVIEAAPEDLRLKQDLFAHLDRICAPTAILATNTSTLSVTAIAAATLAPQRVAGLHFFNPAPLMPLVEVVQAAQSAPETIHSLVALAEKLGKTPIVVRDTPGFIVNRAARPFYGEALRLLGEGVATVEEIDRLVRLGGGFRMGPFQLMDLIGIDVNFAATQSMYEQTFGEPRYRPHPIQARLVEQKALGRKTGQGFYRYDVEQPPDPPPPEISRARGVICLAPGNWAPGLTDLCRQAGYELQEPGPLNSASIYLGIAQCSTEEGLKEQLNRLDLLLPPHMPLLCPCAEVTLAQALTWVTHKERLVGFDSLFFAQGRMVSLVASPALAVEIRRVVEAFVKSLGRLPLWIEDSPGLILPRLISALVNEAAFLLQDGVAEPEQIDLAMQLGANYPRGPLAWGRDLGYAKIVRVLDHLHAEFGEERYRVAPLLRRWARLA